MNLNTRRLDMPKTIANDNQEGFSRLEMLHREYLTKYQGKTTQARATELVQGYLRARANKEEQERRLKKSALDESAAAEALVRECCGKSRVAISGVPYIPMSRGSRVFFRKDMTDYVDLTDYQQ